MARINIEDELIGDPRFKIAVQVIGDEDKAVGMAYRMFRLAQKYWGSGRSLIPAKLFELSGLNVFLDVGLAETKGEEIYVKGSEDQFEWLADRRESGSKGGKKSAEVRKKKYGSAVPVHATNAKDEKTEATEAKSEAPPKQNRSTAEANAEAKPNPLALTPSLTLTQNTDVIPSSVVVTRAREATPRSYEIPPYEKLKLTATRAVSLVIAAFTECGRDAEAAKQKLDPIIWEVLAEKFPTRTWELWGLNYQKAINRDGENFFERDLNEHFKATLPVVMNRPRESG